MDDRKRFRTSAGEQPEDQWSNDARGISGRETAGGSKRNKREPGNERKVVSEKPANLGHSFCALRAFLWLLLKRGRTRDDFDDFVGDRRLTDAIHIERQAVYQLARILRRRIHRRHARTVFRRNRFQQRAEDLRLD